MPWSFIDALFTLYSPHHPMPTKNVHILLSEFRLFKPWAAPVLSAENLSELTNTPLPSQYPLHSQFSSSLLIRLLFPLAHVWHLLCTEHLLWTSHCSRHWGHRTSSPISSPQLGLSTQMVWSLLPLPSLPSSPATVNFRAPASTCTVTCPLFWNSIQNSLTL